MILPGEGSRRPIPWREIFVTLADMHHWTPRQVGRLTFAQVWICLQQRAPDGPVVRMGLHEAKAWIRERRRQRNRWIAEQMQADRGRPRGNAGRGIGPGGIRPPRSGGTGPGRPPARIPERSAEGSR